MFSVYLFPQFSPLSGDRLVIFLFVFYYLRITEVMQYIPDHVLDVSDSGSEPQKDAPSVCILMCDGEMDWCAKGLPSALSMSNACRDVRTLTINPQNGKKNSHASWC